MIKSITRNITRKQMAADEFTVDEILQAVSSNRLLSVELEMTSACNLRCKYCYSDANKASADELTFEKLIDAVRQACDLGARKVVILGGGEPCVYPELRKLITEIRSLCCHVEMFTNGTLIDSSLAEFLYENGVAVVVKRNSALPRVQDELAAVPGTFNSISKGLEHLGKVGYPDANHGLGVQTIICQQNLGEIPYLWRWARQQNIEPYFECLTSQGRCNEHEKLHVTSEETKKIFEELSRIDREEFNIDWIPHPPLAGAHCLRHKYSVLIKANGEIWPCVGVSIPLGNIRKDRLGEVLCKSVILSDLRHIHERIKGTCKTCENNGLCYGCRGNAYQLTGDYLASDPHCWIGQAMTCREGYNK